MTEYHTSMPIYPLQRVFYPQNRPCTPKIVGTFYMQGYKVKKKTAIVPPVNYLLKQSLFQNKLLPYDFILMGHILRGGHWVLLVRALIWLLI
jgi:hypothetical protein